MKQTIRVIIILVLALTMTFMMCSCGKKISKEELTGIWIGSWEYNGAQIDMGIQFDDDETYSKVSYRDGEALDYEVGTYEIKGSTVICYVNGNDGVKKKYKYDGESLANGDNRLYKN